MKITNEIIDWRISVLYPAEFSSFVRKSDYISSANPNMRWGCKQCNWEMTMAWNELFKGSYLSKPPEKCPNCGATLKYYDKEKFLEKKQWIKEKEENLEVEIPETKKDYDESQITIPPMPVTTTVPASKKKTATELKIEKEEARKRELDMIAAQTQPLLEENPELLERWGRGFLPDEYARLEKMYADMMNSYKIDSPTMKETCIMICKLGLKSQQAINLGDIAESEKNVKLYDLLIKQASLQKKDDLVIQEEEEDFVFETYFNIESVSQLVGYLEGDEFIERYSVGDLYPADQIDKTIDNLKGYIKNLVEEDLGLANAIEIYLSRATEADDFFEGRLIEDEEDTEEINNNIEYEDYDDDDDEEDEDYEDEEEEAE